LMSRKATVCSSEATMSAGISPETMPQNRQSANGGQAPRAAGTLPPANSERPLAPFTSG
jgi:hypothetical protein